MVEKVGVLEMKNTIEIVIGEPVQLVQNRWLIAMSLKHTGIHSIESVRYKLISDNDSKESSSEDIKMNFYEDFEFNTHSIENCRVNVCINLQDKNIEKEIELTRKQQVIPIELEGRELPEQSFAEVATSRGGSIVPILILFLAADPSDESRLRLGKEFEEIQTQLENADRRECFNLERPHLALQTDILSNALLKKRPQIVHFSGHGTPSGALCFEDESGKSFLVKPEAIASFFELFANCVECVLLNACNSEPQAKAIAKHINYTIGWKKRISDKAAIAFSVGFYQKLGAKPEGEIEDAYNFGCVQAELQGHPKEFRPILFKKK